MDPQDLANRLRDMYTGGLDWGRAVTMVHLFGIVHARDLEACGASDEDIVRSAGMPKSYATEVHKGRRLAEYVTVRDGAFRGGRA